MAAGSLATTVAPGRPIPQKPTTVVTHPTGKNKSGSTKVGSGTSQPVDGGAAQLYSAWPLSDVEWLGTGFQPAAGGYDGAAAQVNHQRKSQALNKASGVLQSGRQGPQMSLLVTGVSMDTSLAGSTAQSKLIQDFYPKNFVQPSITITGWSLDQSDYSLLCEFVRYCQLQNLNAGRHWASQMTQLVVYGQQGITYSGNAAPTSLTDQAITYASAHPEAKNNPQKVYTGTVRGIPNGTYGASTNIGPDSTSRQVAVSYGKGESAYNQLVKGGHDTIIAKGYVASMPRVHQQFQYAVEWEFEFVIAVMIHGLYHDNKLNVSLPNGNGDASKGTADGTWLNILADAQSVGMSTVSAAQNQASLAYAAQNSSKYLGESPAGGSANANSGGGSNGPAAGYQYTVGASMYGGTGGGSCGNLQDGGMHFAELSQDASADDFHALGGLPCGTALYITYKGQTITATKADVGGGGDDVQGHHRCVDLYTTLADKLGFSGVDLIKIERVDGKPINASDVGPATVINGGGGGSPTSVMSRLASYAKTHSTFGEDGRCLTHVQDFADAVNWPGGKYGTISQHTVGIGNLGAWDAGVHVKANASAYGVKVLDVAPKDAPAGSIVFVQPNSAGAGPTYGDASVPDGNGNFYNGGDNQNAGLVPQSQSIVIAPLSYGG